MMTLPEGVEFQSWANDRLPEMLWACLVISVLPREAGLETFREIAAIGLNNRDNEQAKGWSLNLSALPDQPADVSERVVRTVTRHPLGYAALRPLLLMGGLPGRGRWEALLATSPSDDDWQTLGNAVLTTFDHQSQEATDVRWLSLLFKVGLGVVHFPASLRERAEEIVQYPRKGDMRSVRPSIRAAEMAFGGGINGKAVKSAWPEAFWRECLHRTECVPMPPPKQTNPNRNTEDLARELLDIRMAVLEHWRQTLSTSGVDAKHDSVFGFVFFALSSFLEMMSGLNGQGISGRVLLRSLTECRITLAYLIRCGDETLWGKFRSYGAGQAKLVLLKLEEGSGRTPTFVEKSTLEAIVNEDFYREFVSMDLGHWCGKDLRRMAEESGTKEDYDRFYGWTSGFVHGHWGALRDSNLTYCMNPLHRFHRVPLLSHRRMEDAVPDAGHLINAILDDLNLTYPGLSVRFKIKPEAEVCELSE